jgi:hypothetical protein
MRARHRAAIGAVASMAALGIAQPASAQFFPSDCMESGGGQIITADGDPATFGGNASTERRSATRLGNQVYIDHGPVTPLRFRSITLDRMVCNLDARTAEMSGEGRVTTALGPEQPVDYEIEVFAPSNQSSLPDFYRITLSNGYTSGFQPVVHGNINLVER